LIWGSKDEPGISIGHASVERTTILLDTLAKALVSRGYEPLFGKDIQIRVETEPFKLRLYETKNKKLYEPSLADIKRQAEYDDRSRRHPTLYPPGKAVWPRWDHYPSGRLCIELTDTTLYRWKNANLVGRWYDRKTRVLEDYLGETIVALTAAAALAKHRRAKAEEKARVQAEHAERRRREQASGERIQKRHDYLLKKAEAYAAHNRLVELQNVLMLQSTDEDSDPLNRIISVLHNLNEANSRQFEASAIRSEVIGLSLFSDEDEI